MTLPDFRADPAGESPPAGSERPSKTQRKKAMHELQDLGDALVLMPDDRLARIDMPERVLDAVREYKRTKSHEGRRRQMQFIGKLLRGADDAPIRDAIQAFELGAAQDALDLHRAEAWRARLIHEDQALTDWMSQHPQTDLTRLRALIRNARKDAAAAPEQRSGRAFREIFQFIKQALLQRAEPAGADAPEHGDDHE